jgi:spore coat protein U-like protein
MQNLRRGFSGAALAGLCLVGGTPAAWAQACSVSLTDMNFGSVARPHGGPVDTTATLTASCTGTGNQIIQLCPVVPASTGGLPGGQLAHTADARRQVPFLLFADPGHTVPWQAGFNVRLNANGNGSERRTIYGRMFPAVRAVKGGKYRAAITVSFAASYVLAGQGSLACASAGPPPPAPLVAGHATRR